MSWRAALTATILIASLLSVAGEPSTRPAGAKKGPTARVTVPSRWKLTEQQERETLAFLQEHFADQYESALKLKDENPKAYDSLLRSRWYFLQRVKGYPPHVGEAYVEQYKANTELYAIVRQIRETKDPKAIESLKKDLHEPAARLFAAQQIIREHSLAKLEKRLKEYRTKLREQAADPDRFIKKIVDRWEKLAEAKKKHTQVAPRPAPQPAATTQPSSTTQPAE